jgi:hypothetical protein
MRLTHSRYISISMSVAVLAVIGLGAYFLIG